MLAHLIYDVRASLMSLTPRTRIGPYEIIGAIGAGGMGEVYRARDTKLDRDVALKILPGSVAADPDRLMRFEREAKTLATLNHPNIAQVYGLETSGETQAIILELVEGPTLEEAIREKSEVGSQESEVLEWALPIAFQVASALEAAHEAGIVHRDLKPANIKVRADGTVKVLDFGLAKAMDPAGSGSSEAGSSAVPADSPTMTSPALTAMGVILGTAAYMAPEQAKGRPVDKRADIWAFGVVLHEMLTGRQLFAADTVGEVLAAVLRADIDLDALPAATPPNVRHLLARCLDRDPKTRLRDIGEARIAIDRAGSLETVTADTSGRRTWLPAAVAAVVTGVAAFFVAWSLGPAPARIRAVAFDLGVENIRDAVISPEGARVAYRSRADGQLWVRDLDRLEPTPLVVVDSLGAIGGPGLFWSPDGSQVGYSSGGSLWKVDADGGTPVEICRLENGAITGAAWTADGRVVFGSWRGGLYEVPASGATEPTLLIDVEDGIEDYHAPRVLPNGALTFMPHWVAPHEPALHVLQAGQLTVLEGTANGQYSAGYLISSRGGTSPGLWATPFDLDRLETTGNPVLILPNVTTFSASYDGTLLHAAGVDDTPQLVRIAWLDRTGGVEPLPAAADEYRWLSLSPDGTTLAAVVTDRGEERIVLIDVARGATRPLVAPSGTRKRGLLWSPDGRYLLFSEERGFVDTIQSVPADGSREPTDIVEGSWPTLSPDGRQLAFDRDNRGRRNLWVLPVEEYQPAGQPTLMRESPLSLENPVISPDGSLVAYVQGPPFRTSRTEGSDVFLSRFPDGSGQWAVSVGGGAFPTWDPDTGDLLYVQDGNILAVPITPGAEPVLGESRFVMPLDPSGALPSHVHLVLSRDGRRLLTRQPIETGDDADPVRLIVVHNWPAAFAEAMR